MIALKSKATCRKTPYVENQFWNNINKYDEKTKWTGNKQQLEITARMTTNETINILEYESVIFSYSLP